jgi:hypothetical protein
MRSVSGAARTRQILIGAGVTARRWFVAIAEGLHLRSREQIHLALAALVRAAIHAVGVPNIRGHVNAWMSAPTGFEGLT